ncbi:hypothetical protein [Bradyrhizobium centrolobii]|uniref:hypothetical protein n=1 Tax=Bradyrhizobium centrolobii TaxID=1505087 RepID=UPI000A90B845|nr:hypothetical protein [Bradyrhizobium centrolobii]
MEHKTELKHLTCSDGIGHEISENISNALKLYRRLRKTDKTQRRSRVNRPLTNAA